MTDAPTRWIDPNPPQPDTARTTTILAVSGILLTVAVVVTLVAVVLSANSEDRSATTDDALLIAANTPTALPFTRPIVVAPTVLSDEVRSATAELLQQIPVRADRGVRPVPGRQPHLYGATGATPPCDVVTLANYLDADPATARAWGLALGLNPQQIPYYLNTLTPVVLLADTWVGVGLLENGTSEAKQAVLQAGNAVLIDPLGVPRTHCASGAPLTPPANTTLSGYRLNGQQWPAFSPQAVVAVQYATAGKPQAAGDFTLVDISTGEPVTRSPGGIIELGGASVALPDPAVMNVPPPTATAPTPARGTR